MKLTDSQKTRIYLLTAVGAIVALIVMFAQSKVQMAEMTEVFEEEKEMLITEYQDLYIDYDSLQSNNNDLNNQLDMERERVAQLYEELKTVKATNARRIRELQGELKTLRTVMVGFVKQIDSLNQINITLAEENSKMKSQVARVRQSYNDLAKQNESLNEKVEIAQRLEAKNVQAEGLNFKEKRATAADKVSKIKVSFTLAKNVSAQVGMRDVYMRITRPDGQLLMHSRSDVFQFEGSEINFSSKRQVEYGGEDTPAYIVYMVDAGELMAGEYDVELFCGGELIGQCRFSLKN